MKELSAYFVNSSLVESAVDNVITATSNSMEIYFRDELRHEQYTLTSLVVSCPEDSTYPAKIKLNNLNSILIIPIGGEEIIDGLNILKLTYVGEVGGKFSFKGLGDSVCGNYFTI